MKLSTLLDHIDNGHLALPEFQRGYVWNRDQVRGLMQSLYRGYPVGSLLVWATVAELASTRGDGAVAPGIVKLLLDGQQRMTSLYGIIRGRPPAFFDGDASAFTGLRFHLEGETFEFYLKTKMDPDPLWIDVTDLMRRGTAGLGAMVGKLSGTPEYAAKVGDYVGRLSRLLAIADIEFAIAEITDSIAQSGESPLDVVVEIFNRVNSGGTKLSKGDLALARLCAQSPDARDRLKKALAKWREAGFSFDLDWLLRSVNTVTTGKAKFAFLHHVTAPEFSDGLVRAEKATEYLLNAISGRLGLDHDRVLFGRYAFPVMTRYVDLRGGSLADGAERDLLLFWYLQNAMWGRFSSSVESTIDEQLALLDGSTGASVGTLIDNLRLWRGGLKVEPDHFGGHSLGARFYPVLYLLTRTGEARDWGHGLPLKSHLLGKMSSLEVHHIFPKARLRKAGYGRAEINAVANFCFLTKDTNLKISARPPEEYFVEIESKHPGALASQWIPMDPVLWKVANYRDFLAARRVLLSDAANRFLGDLLHSPDWSSTETGSATAESTGMRTANVPGGIDSEEEEAALEALNAWAVENHLPEGEVAYELVGPDGQPMAVLDLAWPKGLQPGLSQPVAVLLDEGPETFAAASAAGFRCFASVTSFKEYARTDVGAAK